jgi:hypothetical protein
LEGLSPVTGRPLAGPLPTAFLEIAEGGKSSKIAGHARSGR